MKNLLLVIFFILNIPSLWAQDKPLYTDLRAFTGFASTYQQQTPFMVQGEKRGDKFVLKYNFIGQDVPPPAEKILKHYISQITQRNGKVLTQQAGAATMEFPKDQREVWVQLKVLKPSAYEMVVIEKIANKQNEGILVANLKDMIGSKDYPLLPRYPNYIILDYKEEDFYMGFKLSGYKYQINYAFADSINNPPSDEIVVNQYINYVKKYNGRILTNDGALATMEFTKDNINRWIQIGAFGNEYELIVVEKDLKKDYNAPIVKNKPYNVTATQKSQIVVADNTKIIDDKEVAMNQLKSTTPLDNTGRNFVVNELPSVGNKQLSVTTNQSPIPNSQLQIPNYQQQTTNNKQQASNIFQPNIQITSVQGQNNYTIQPQPTNNYQQTSDVSLPQEKIDIDISEDKAGSRDYPTLPRRNNYIIAEYKEEDFYMGYKLAGYKYHLNYVFANPNANPPSDESIINQYINLVKGYGGKVLTSDGALATLEYTRNNINRWIQIGSFGRNYEIVIVEKDLKRNYSVPLASNKPYFLAPTQKNELIVDESGKIVETQTQVINPNLSLIPDNEKVKRNFMVNESANQPPLGTQTTAFSNYQLPANSYQYTASTATNNQQLTTSNSQFVSAPTSAGSVEDVVNNQISMMLAGQGRAILNQINFTNENSTELREDASFSIYLLAMYLKNNPNKKFYIISHVAKSKDLGKDIAISERRAQIVVDELMKIYKFDKDRIKPKGLGSLSPVANTTNTDGRNENDRVEIIEQ
jgi:outer membrane protein OmpA-like peptidoglycan-associated protein